MMMTIGSAVRDGTVTVGGLRLHYRDWGMPTSPPLVLIHGRTSNARSWDGVAAAMVDRFRVLAIDVRGHGESEHAHDYRLESLVAEFGAFVDALEPRPFALMGLSMGGLIAFAYAAEHADRVRRLVIVEAAPDAAAAVARSRPTGRSADPELQTFADPEQAVRLARERNPNRPAELQRKLTVESITQKTDGSWTYRHDVRGMSQFLDDLPPEDTLWSLLPRIR